METALTIAVVAVWLIALAAVIHDARRKWS